jgi:hypothetical protein
MAAEGAEAALEFASSPVLPTATQPVGVGHETDSPTPKYPESIANAETVQDGPVALDGAVEMMMSAVAPAKAAASRATVCLVEVVGTMNSV